MEITSHIWQIQGIYSAKCWCGKEAVMRRDEKGVFHIICDEHGEIAQIVKS